MGERDANDFGKRLAAEIKRRGLNNTSFGELVGISRVQISNYVTGKNLPGSDTMATLAQHLGMSVSELTGETPSRWVDPRVALLGEAVDLLSRMNEDQLRDVLGPIRTTSELTLSTDQKGKRPRNNGHL